MVLSLVVGVGLVWFSGFCLCFLCFLGVGGVSGIGVCFLDMLLYVSSHGLRVDDSASTLLMRIPHSLAYSPALWLTDSCLYSPSRML